MKKGLSLLSFFLVVVLFGHIFFAGIANAMPMTPLPIIESTPTTPTNTTPAPVLAPPMPAQTPMPAATPAPVIITTAATNTTPAINATITPPAAPTLLASATTAQTPTVAPTTPAPDTPQAIPSTPNQVASVSTTPEEDKKEIYLNFENTELASFVEYIAELKKLNVIPDKSMEGSKISLSIREPLSVEGAWNVFLTVLEMAGFSIVKAGVVHKVIPKDKKIMQPLPAYINVPYDKLPDNDLTIRYVLFLTNIQVETIQPLLESMLSTPNSIHAQKDMNAFVITDKSYNIRAAAKLLTELDQMGLPESVTVLRLKQANATDVKALLDSLIAKPDNNPLARLLGKAAEGGTEYFASSTRVVAEERTNSLILMGTNKSIDKIIAFITKHIDTQIKEAESPLHIYELQHIDAKQVLEILKEVTGVPESATGQAAGKYGSIRGGVKYFRDMKFQVDKDGNRLLVSCIDKQDWKLLKKTIQDLDKPQPQVAIETLIVTVTVKDDKYLAGAIRNKKHGQIGKNIDFQSAAIGGTSATEKSNASPTTPISLLGNMFDQVAATQGQSVLTFGKGANIWAIFEAFKQETNSSILAQPFVTVANKTSAKVEIGSTQRVTSEESLDSDGKTTNTGKTEAKASTILTVVPQINLDGIIGMDIKLDIEEFGDTADIKTVNHLDSKVSVADGQVLVLGGFVKTKVDETKFKTPILGDIPILGWFFKSHQRTINKQYIFIFMAPTIIKPRQSPGMQLYTKMKLHQATDDIEEAVDTKRNQDPIHNWFFNPEKENYSHKVIDFANARYQPTTVDIKHDSYYRASVDKEPTEQQTPSTQPVEPVTKTTNEPVAILSAADIKAETDNRTETAAAPVVQPEIPVDALSLQREKLKSLISTALPTPVQTAAASAPLAPTETQAAPAPAATPPLVSVENTMSKRDTLKQFLSTPTEQPQKENFIADPEKRNKLKDFLSANRSLRSPPNNLGERKA